VELESREGQVGSSHREDKVAAVDELIEKEMELIGSTAIEDKL
jgi:hypothetical protein